MCMLALPPIVIKVLTPITTHATTILAGIAIAALILMILLSIHSDTFLLRRYRAEKTDNQQILHIVEELSLKADITPPPVYITSIINAPNALAVGGRKPKIILTQRALSTPFLEETVFLLAREIADIRYSHLYLKTMASVLCGLITSLPTLVLWAALLTGFGQENDPAPKLFKLLATAATAPLAAIPLQILRTLQPEEKIHTLASQLFEAEMLEQTGRTLSYSETAERLREKQAPFEADINPSHAPLFAVNPLPVDQRKMNLYNPLFTGGTPRWRHIFLFSALAYTVLFFLVTVISTFAAKDFMMEVVALRAQAYFPLILFTLLLCYSLIRKNQYRGGATAYGT